MSANQPTSFRFPFDLSDDVHPQVRAAVRYAFSSLKDLNDAITLLHPKVATNITNITNLTTQVTQAQSSIASANSAFVKALNAQTSVGTVNNQSAATSYKVQQSDFGALIVLNPSSPFAFSLNNNVGTPFFCVVESLGSGVVTVTPPTGTINNLASWPIPSAQAVLLFFDGINWWAASDYPTVFTRGGTILSPSVAMNVIIWYAPFPATVTNVLGYVDVTSGSVINARRNGALSLLAGDLTLGSTGTWIDGGAVQNTAISIGDKLELMVVSVAGAPTQIAVEIQCTRP